MYHLDNFITMSDFKNPWGGNVWGEGNHAYDRWFDGSEAAVGDSPKSSSLVTQNDIPFYIYAKRTNTVNNILIDKDVAEFIAYQLFFVLESPDAGSEYLDTPAIVMFENKSFQEGDKAPNALTVGQTYDLAWKKMSSFKDLQVHIKRLKQGHSDRTYIHPLSTSSPAQNSAIAAYTVGCKGVCFESDVQISTDKKHIYAGPPYFYLLKDGGNVIPDDQRKNSGDCWENSYAAMTQIRKLYIKGKGALTQDNDFKLTIEV